MFRNILTLLMFSVLAVKVSAREIPDVVVRYADSFAQLQPVVEQLPTGQVLRDEYAKIFFTGFTHPSGGVCIKSALLQDAYTHGQTYWRDHPSDRAKIFSEYGYVAVEREGLWSHGFEKSAFEASGASGGKWWMTPLGDGPWKEVGLEQGTGNALSHIRIVGYLSPKGNYGHLGAYEHEVLVTAGARIDSSNH